MAKTKQVSLKPITISLKLAGLDQVFDTDNILNALRGLAIEPTEIKSLANFSISYNGDTYRRVLTIAQMKRLLANDIVRQITAKKFNVALGIPCEDYA